MSSPRRYLVVDDNPAFADNLAEILEESGASVDVVSSGLDALERATHTQYDVLISDMRMPSMDGAELLHQIRSLDPGLPAVVITAYTNDRDLDAARREGIFAVFPKPAPLADLKESVAWARRDGIVVVVEHDATLLINLTEALRTHGFSVVTAGSVVETQHIAAVKPFVALVDLRIPGGAGGIAMRCVAARFPEVPLIVLTAPAASPRHAGHHSICHSPIETAAFVAAVERVYLRQHA